MEKLREIIYQKEEDGYFSVPEEITPDKEVMWQKVRLDSVRLAQYSDSKCGLPNTFDEDGGYLCGGRKDSSSSPCNKFAFGKCVILSHGLSDPEHQSCGFWEVRNSGDKEVQYCKKGKFNDDRAQFGSTDNDLGFSCKRCEYGQIEMGISDSEGRNRWCKKKGMPVEDEACCADNDPYKFEYDEKQEREYKSMGGYVT